VESYYIGGRGAAKMFEFWYLSRGGGFSLLFVAIEQIGISKVIQCG
jgi:hypothetical protein